MASASLATMQTACVRLRDALDRWLVAFEVMAHEAAATGAVMKKTEPSRKRLASPSSVKLCELASGEGGVTALQAAKATGLTRASTAARLCNLADRGHLTKVAMPGRPVHFFAKAEHATAWAATGGAPELEPAAACEVLEVGMPAPVAPMPDLQLLSAGVAQFAAMVEADAAAVEKAMSVIAPTPRAEPAPAAAPRPKPRTPTPPPGSEEQNAKRDEPLGLRPKGEVIVPPDVKRTTVEAPKYDRRFGVDPEAPIAGGFSDEWRRLRGELV